MQATRTQFYNESDLWDFKPSNFSYDDIMAIRMFGNFSSKHRCGYRDISEPYASMGLISFLVEYFELGIHTLDRLCELVLQLCFEPEASK